MRADAQDVVALQFPFTRHHHRRVNRPDLMVRKTAVGFDFKPLAATRRRERIIGAAEYAVIGAVFFVRVYPVREEFASENTFGFFDGIATQKRQTKG